MHAISSCVMNPGNSVWIGQSQDNQVCGGEGGVVWGGGDVRTRSFVQVRRLTPTLVHTCAQIVSYKCAKGEKFRQEKRKVFRGHNTAGYACGVAFSPDGK